MHMDESKPPIPFSELCRRSASERTSNAIDPVPAELAKSAERAASERQSHVGQVQVRQNDPPDRPSVAVYYRNEEEVREGFLVALSAMGIAVIEQLPEPAKPPIGSAKP
jgi:hypothetical protein